MSSTNAIGRSIALHIAEQADRLLAHRPDAPDVLVAARHREAAAAIAGPRRGKHFGNLPERRLDLALGIADEFDQVDTGGGLAVVVREECPHVLPDGVALSQAEDLGVHGLDRGRAEADQCPGIAQGGIEAVIAHIDQRAVGGNGQNVEFGLDEKAERAFRSAQDRIEIEAAALVSDMGQIIAGQATVEFGKVPVDQLRLVAGDIREQPVDRSDPVGPLARLRPAPFHRAAPSAIRYRREGRSSAPGHGGASCRRGTSPARRRRC